MRHCIAVLAFCWLFLQCLAAQTVRVASWELEGLEATGSDALASESEAKRPATIADTLRGLDADVIILRGIPDAPAAKRVAASLKPLTYYVALHCTLKKSRASNAGPAPTLTILSRKEPFVARVTEWRSTPQLDSPGGFAFVGLNSGTNPLCLYVAHLPAEEAAVTTRRDVPPPIRKRELAAQYLARHANWLAGTLTNQVASCLMTGDFLADSRGARTDGAVRILQQAGFNSGFVASPAGKRVGQVGGESSAPPAFEAVLVRNAEFAVGPRLVTRETFSRAIVAYDLALAPPPLNPVPASSPIRAIHLAWDQRLVPLWLGAIAGLCLVIGLALWLIGRVTPSAGVLGKRPGNTAVLDLSVVAGTAERFAASLDPAPDDSGRTRASTAAECALWQERAEQAEYRANQATAVVQAGLMPQLSRLLRGRLVSWLSSQRSQLLVAHEIGTQQVIELEERLKKIQDQFAERLQSLEQHIAELEREILAKERIIRDLLRAQVRAANEGNPDFKVSGQWSVVR